jgi:hypothetical protein
VPAVPIYIQEKIQPKAIVENVRAIASLSFRRFQWYWIRGTRRLLPS